MATSHLTALQSWPEWFEPRLPGDAECSPAVVLRQRAESDPQGLFVKLEDGSPRTNLAAFVEMQRTARLLAGMGLKDRDRVVLWMPNGPDMLRYLLGCWVLGVTPVPLNVALLGAPLAHVLRTVESRVIVCHPALAPRLADVDPAVLSATSTLVSVENSTARQVGSLAVLSEADIEQPPNDMAIGAPRVAKPWDIAAIIFSSGTTGLAKGVQAPFGQLWTLGRAFYGWMQPDDRMLLALPLFHVAALGALFGALAARSSLALNEAFRAADFFDVLRRTGATTAPGLGRTLIDVLNKLPPRADDGDNPLRAITVQSSNAAVREFARRFQCRVIPSYSMTETSCIAIAEMDCEREGSLGRPRAGLEVRLVDAHDLEVPVGSPGEVIVRSSLPWTLNAGYFRNPEATTDAWRNGWFHTGDIARADADGYLYYMDRSKDVIRRRSENISSVEIEAEVRQHPDVQDVAAVGVETAGGEEIMVVVAPRPDRSVDPLALTEFLVYRLPHFMVPRFVRVVAELPKTQGTARVQKADLRKAGVTSDTWDRETAGIRLQRPKL